MPPPKKFENFDLEAFLAAPDVRHFINQDVEFFADLWRADYAKKDSMDKVLFNLHWNGLAIMFSPVAWFSYRKMYRESGIVIAGIVLAAVLSKLLHIHPGPAALIGAMVALGAISYSLYFSHVHNNIARIRELPEGTRTAEIDRRGGVSINAGIMGAIGYFIALLLYAVIVGA